MLVLATVLVMHVTSGSDLHLANGGGAINTDHEETITVTLGAKQAVTVTATGKDTDDNLYADQTPSWTTHEITTWKTVWVGTYALPKASMMTLDLRPKSHTCSHTHAYDDAKPEKRDCEPAPSTHAVFSCTREAGAKNTDVWMCTPSETTTTSEATSSWRLASK